VAGTRALDRYCVDPRTFGSEEDTEG
jgi:hypothetical protein